jgi:D-alanyl-lipoteichoic acid acyltransferase DltB (MBOAT superfamily)
MSTLAVQESALPRVAVDPTRLRRFATFLGIAAQLALALLVIQQFQLESRTFYTVARLAAVGFVVNAALPLRFRLRFFVALSLGTLGVAFGAHDAVLLTAVGAGLVGICHLPIAARWRALLLAVVGVWLAASRAGVALGPLSIDTIWSPSVWPILGSMFMFRLALYLHAMGTEAKRPTAVEAAAYFFMLPNAVFPLYPVVDFSTFRRTYYDQDALKIYQTGARWVARGLVQLLMYRYVYYHLVRDPAEVRTLGDLLTFLLATFGLYLRVSGQFHLIVGLLHLFGFRLPETHKLYFLSSSFTDFWRRINIYWKDFMMKLVYYPSFFRLRRFGPRVALGGATAIVFFATWLLHSYQWFWLRGGFPVTAPDVLFWGILGGLVLWTALREAARGRDRAQGAKTWNLALAAKTVGVFWAICVLWSLWSAESVAGWVQIWTAAANVDARGLLLLGVAVGGHLALAGRNWTAPTLGAKRVPWWREPAVLTSAMLLAVLAAGRTSLYAATAPRTAAVVASLRQSTLNKRDQSLRHRGYYEKLDNVDRFSTQVWQTMAKTPASFRPLALTPAWRIRNDLLAADLRPSTHIEFYGRPFTTNSFGMRDREYPLAKPAGTWRMAFFGPSHVMGAGVGDGEQFESVLESRMNAELATNGAAGGGYAHFEVLNFGAIAYSLLQQDAMLLDRGVGFRPDVVVVTLYSQVPRTTVDHLSGVLWSGRPIPDDTLRTLLARAGVADPGRTGAPVPGQFLRKALGAVGVPTRMPWSEGQLLLRRHSPEITAYVIRKLARDITAAGAVPVLLALDQVEPEGTDRDVVNPLLDEARHAGFLVLDLFDVYDGKDPTSLRVADWDNHPNVAGHRLIADRLFDEIRRHADALRIGRAGLATR